jgi:hypothetical protein
MSSKLLDFDSPWATGGGTHPVKFTMDNKDTWRNAKTGLRVLLHDDMSAELMSVQRPVVWAIVANTWGNEEAFSIVSHTGSTNVGLKLEIYLVRTILDRISYSIPKC